MYASVRRYRVDPDQVSDLMHRVDTGFAEQIAGEPGFAGYQAVDCADGTIVTVTCFRDEASAEDSNERAAAWVAENLADLDVERVEVCGGEVMVSRAQAEMLEAAHH
jgi:antibiotic biosynthesis monooxygenase